MKKLIITLLSLFLAGTVIAEPTIDAANIDNDDINNRIQAFLETLNSQQKTALAKRIKTEDKVANNPYSLILYKPTYILPFYYTGTPYKAIYQHQTPEGQTVMSSEFKFQLSFQVPIVNHFFGDKNTLSIGYTQDSFWQVYAKSQYFRETNYEPEIFLRRLQTDNFSWQLGIVHQSNGRGGEYERSWNRTYLQGIYSGSNWAVQANLWALIFKAESSDLHNPQIAHYLGNGNLIMSYKFGDMTLSLMSRNNLQSGFERGAEQLTFSFPLHGHFRGFVYAFSGYGQSLIEYDHYTNAVALGIALNDWI
jgi:phospholipase A1